MGLSSNSPVVLTVVTSGQSFARSFSVKVGDVFVFVFSYICKLVLALGQAGVHYVLEKTSDISDSPHFHIFLLQVTQIDCYSLAKGDIAYHKRYELYIYNSKGV